MADHVLIGINESDPAEQALDYTLAEYPDATITLHHVIEADHPYAPTRTDDTVDDFAEYVREYHGTDGGVLERAVRIAAERENVRTELRTGKVARETVECAEERDVDHVVIGSHGRTGPSRILLGSVAEKIVRRSPVPVTVIR